MAEASVSFPLPRAQRRRIERAADAVDRVLEGDRRFFTRYPDRNHRVRLMSAPERDQLAAANNCNKVTAPYGREWAVAVRQVSRGVRLRCFAAIPEGSDLDQNEDTCRRFFDLASRMNSQAAEVEASLRQAFGGGS